MKLIWLLCAGLLLAGCIGSMQVPNSVSDKPERTVTFHHDLTTATTWCEVYIPKQNVVYHWSAHRWEDDPCGYLR